MRVATDGQNCSSRRRELTPCEAARYMPVRMLALSECTGNQIDAGGDNYSWTTQHSEPGSAASLFRSFSFCSFPFLSELLCSVGRPVGLGSGLCLPLGPVCRPAADRRPAPETECNRHCRRSGNLTTISTAWVGILKMPVFFALLSPISLPSSSPFPSSLFPLRSARARLPSLVALPPSLSHFPPLSPSLSLSSPLSPVYSLSLSFRSAATCAPRQDSSEAGWTDSNLANQRN